MGACLLQRGARPLLPPPAAVLLRRQKRGAQGHHDTEMVSGIQMDNSTLAVKKRGKHITANQRPYVNEAKSGKKTKKQTLLLPDTPPPPPPPPNLPDIIWSLQLEWIGLLTRCQTRGSSAHCRKVRQKCGATHMFQRFSGTVFSFIV